MKKISVLAAVLFVAHLSAQEPPTPEAAGNKPSVGVHQKKEAAVTFHVIGMKKTASGAT